MAELRFDLTLMKVRFFQELPNFFNDLVALRNYRKSGGE